MIKPTIKKIVALVLVLAISGYSILGFFQLYKKVDTSTILKRISSNLYSTTSEFNNLFENICSAKSDAGNKPTPVNEKNAKKTPGILFYIFSMCFISQSKILMLCLIALTIVMTRERKFMENYKFSLLKPPDIVFYKNWILKFMTPLQKCMENRSDEYDINPIKVILWGKKPALWIYGIPSAGFLMYK